MFNNIILQLDSFIYIAILSIIYFTKRKYNFVESKLYKTLLIVIMFTIIFDSVSIITNENILVFTFLYRICLYILLSLFISYTFLSCNNKKYEKIKDVFVENKIAYLWIAIIIIMFVFLVVSQIKLDIQVIYIFGLAGAILNLFILLFNLKKCLSIKNGQYLCLMLFC